MGDDGIGIRILENIESSLKEHSIEVIIGETDFEYCISEIEDGDYIFIIDAAMLEKKLGTVTIIPIDEYRVCISKSSQHSYSFLDLLSTYHKAVQGYIIGVEVERIFFDLSISKNLQELLQQISSRVLKIILELS